MNVSHILSLLEKLVALYDANEITNGQTPLSPEFLSLVGDVKDTLSSIE